MRFLAILASAALVHQAVGLVLASTAGPHWFGSSLVLAGMLLAVFLGNERWTWGAWGTQGVWRRYARAHVVALGALLVHAVTSFASGFALPAGPASVLGATGAVFCAFLWGEHWVWRSLPSSAAPQGPAEDATAPHATTYVAATNRSPSHRRWLYLAALAIQVCLAASFMHDWDGYVFEHTARAFLVDGETPYETAVEAPGHIYLTFYVPPHNMWYAYPPLPLLLFAAGYLPYLTAGIDAPALGRLAWKAPILVGNLLLPVLVRAYLQGRGVSPTRAQRAEVFLLFNPFLYLIGAVWGMFDVWVFAAIVGSLLCMARGSPAWAGAAFALAILSKPYAALLLLPVLGTLGSSRHLWRFGAGLAATCTAFVVPFLHQWPGMVAQSVTLHATRPPQGFGGYGLLVVLEGISRFFQDPMDPAFLERLGQTWATTLTVALLVALGGLYALQILGGSDRIPGMAAALFLFLVAGKVVNEQYFVVALGFLVLLAHEADPATATWAARAARWLTWAGTVAVLVVGFHIMTFVPPDLALRLWGTDPDAAVAAAGAATGLPAPVFYALPSFIAFLLFLPLFVGFTRFTARHVACTWRAARHRLRAGTPARRRRTGTAAIAVAAIACMGIVGAVAPTTHAERMHDGDPGPKGPPAVGVFYYTWWTNPSHRGDLRYGPWTQATAEPEEGFYALNARRIQIDLQQMRWAGIDHVVVSYEKRDLERLYAVVRAAEEVGMKVSVLWEMGILYKEARNQPVGSEGIPLGPTAGLALRQDTMERTRAVLASLPGSLTSSPAWLTHDGEPVFYIYDAYFAHPGFGRGEQEFLIDTVQSMPDAAALRWGGPVSRGALAADYPTTVEDFTTGPRASFWQWAYLQSYQRFWAEVLQGVELTQGGGVWYGGQSWDAGRGPFHGMSTAVAATRVFDGSFVYNPAAVRPGVQAPTDEQRWDAWHEILRGMTHHERAAGHPVIATVLPAYDDTNLPPDRFRAEGFRVPSRQGGVYDDTWTAALAARPDMVLITTWNEHFEGSGIEPTVEHGDRFLHMTRSWSDHFRGARSDEVGPAGQGHTSS